MQKEVKLELSLMTIEDYNNLSINYLDALYRLDWSVKEVDGMMVFYR